MKLNLISVLTTFILSFGCLYAHDPGLSSADVRLSDNEIDVLITFNRSDFEPLLAAVNGIAPGALGIRIDGHPLAAEFEHADLKDGVKLHLRYHSRPGARLELGSLLFDKLPPGHRQFLTVRDAGDRTLLERMLSARENRVEISLDKSNWHAGLSAKLAPAASFVLLGVQHILTGYDHLLFLFGLLLVGGTFSAVARIITAFTLAHSLTLALATLDFVRISSSAVEPLIAASILYIGLENLLRAKLDGRWLLAFAFGLIHGFGFSSVLREMGIGSNGSGVGVPLFSFNLGVELGQIAIAAPVLLLIWRLRRKPFFIARGVPALSLMVSLAGGFWLVQRILPS